MKEFGITLRDEEALKEFGITLMPIRRKDMKKQWSLFEERFIIREHREQIETSFSILSDVMGLNRIKATTLSGFILKAFAAVVALIFTLRCKLRDPALTNRPFLHCEL